MAFELPKLNYEYASLEPSIDARTMEIHHSKHHNGYVTKLNAALDGHELVMSLRELLTNLDDLPDEARTAIRNNGGGHYNHSLFWEIMSPEGGGEPAGALAEAIQESFGDFESFVEEFSKAATTRFGSGWAWLVVGEDKKLYVTSTPNQDNPVMENPSVEPILGIDVWEHAYYLNYQNKRGDYISSWWDVVNWDKVAELYESATQ